MTEALHADLSPNEMNAGGTLEITFDSLKPWKDAKEVIVRVFEIDDASPFEPQAGKGKLVVTFRGSLSDNQFALTPPKTGESNPEIPTVSDQKPPLIKIKIGSTTTDVPLPDKQQEQGIFELRLQVQVVKPKAKTFTNRKKVLVRCFDHFMVNKIPRPVVTFITGASTNNPNEDFFGAAAGFWRLNADAVIVRPGISLQEILEMLAREQDKYGTWGQINIVAHGRAHSIKIKLLQNSEEGVHTDKITDDTGNSALPAPKGFDSETQVVFRACNAGQDQELVNALRASVFGGQGKLFVPKFTQVYEYLESGGNAQANERFEESLTFDTPGTTPPTGIDLQRGLEKAWDRLVSPGKGGNRSVEVPTFSENHDWVQEYPHTRTTGEAEMLNSDGSSMSDADLIRKFRRDWWNEPPSPNNQSSASWKTEASRWEISITSKKPNKDPDVPRRFFMRVRAGTADPMVKEFAGGGQSIGSQQAPNVWVVKAPGVEPFHFSLIFIQPVKGQPLSVKIEDGNSGADTVVGRTRLNGGATREFRLPITVTFGEAQLEVRQSAMTDILFTCKRHFVDRRRLLRTYDDKKPYASRTFEQPTVGKPGHYGSSP